MLALPDAVKAAAATAAAAAAVMQSKIATADDAL